MLTLTPPRLDHIPLLERLLALQSMSRTDTDDLLAEVTEAYTDYQRADHPADVDPRVLPARSTAALTRNWDLIRRVEFAHVRRAVFALSKRCALCGDNRTGAIDHFLPKSLFPEFSVFALNLVPVCNPCNNKKRTAYRHPDATPLFVYPYTTGLIGTRFLEARVRVDDTVRVGFRVDETIRLSPSVVRLLVGHFNRLALNDQYVDAALQYMAERRDAFNFAHEAGGADGVRSSLLVEGRSSANVFGNNHWKPVLITALIDCSAYCDGGFRLLGGLDHTPAAIA